MSDKLLKDCTNQELYAYIEDYEQDWLEDHPQPVKNKEIVDIRILLGLTKELAKRTIMKKSILTKIKQYFNI